LFLFGVWVLLPVLLCARNDDENKEHDKSHVLNVQQLLHNQEPYMLGQPMVLGVVLFDLHIFVVVQNDAMPFNTILTNALDIFNRIFGFLPSNP
jgi:hypothetical protein